MAENSEFDITATVGDAAGVRCGRCQAGPMSHEDLESHHLQAHGHKEPSWNGESEWIPKFIGGMAETQL